MIAMAAIPFVAGDHWRASLPNLPTTKLRRSWVEPRIIAGCRAVPFVLFASAFKQRVRRVPRYAVVEGDAHATAVQMWLDTMIIGMGLCPWAKPANEAGGIRIVTSSASTPQEVLEDLQREAKKLQGWLPEPQAGSPVTTLLVCPSVEEWRDFENFDAFREEILLNGEVLTEEFQCKIVCFHPRQQASNIYGLNVGDEILVDVPGTGEFAGTVLEILGMEMKPPREIKTQFFGKVDQGEDGEMVIEPFLDSDHIATISEDNVTQLLGREALAPEDGCRSILGRAPRVVLHLLRSKDLEAVDDKKAFQALERNEEVVETLGLEGFDDLVKKCG